MDWTVRGSNPGRRRDFSYLSRPALRPTQPPVQWVPDLSRGLDAAGAWRWPLTFSCRGQKQSTAIPLLSLRAFVACERMKLTYLLTLEEEALLYSETSVSDYPMTKSHRRRKVIHIWCHRHIYTHRQSELFQSILYYFPLLLPNFFICLPFFLPFFFTLYRVSHWFLF